MPNDQLTPQYSEAKRFLAIFDPDPSAKFTFQTFPDCRDSSASNGLVNIFHGSLKQHFDTLTKLNRQGAGVFVVVNQTDGNGRREENITAIRAVFSDQDNGPSKVPPLEPTMVVQSKNGDHSYWLLNSQINGSQFRQTQKTIAKQLNSDPKVCDPPRVMRVAGFFHQKSPDDPYLVKIGAYSQKKYSYQEICRAFPQCDAITPSREKERPSFGTTKAIRIFKKWASKLSIKEGPKNPLGGRNNTLLILIREALGCGLSDEVIVESAYQYCELSGLELAVADEMFERQVEIHREKPFINCFVKMSENAADTAEKYLASKKLIQGSHLGLRFYNENFYVYDENSYVKTTKSELRAEIIAFLQKTESTREMAGTGFANDVVVNLEGRTLVTGKHELPKFICNPEKDCSRLVPIKNGILDLINLSDIKNLNLIPHTADFFSVNCLPYEFNRNAKLPKQWLKVLGQILPAEDEQQFIREWGGYCLIRDVKQQKFVVLIGQGANGKGIICAGMRAMLGEKNVASVGLEQFSPTRTFNLAHLDGKLANIVEEMEELNHVLQGVLKNYVGGGVITVERKFEHPFELKPTARLMFATNSMPRFVDRSDGLWRRMIPLQFNNQILDEAAQNKNLTDPKWWLDSGEMPGILNWFIEGLITLTKRGHFVIPVSSQILLKDYQTEANPAAIFLDLHYSKKQGGSVSSRAIYSRYKNWTEKEGHATLGQARFREEIIKKFPQAHQSTNALRHRDGTRSRVWEGIVEIDIEAQEGTFSHGGTADTEKFVLLNTTKRKSQRGRK